MRHSIGLVICAAVLMLVSVSMCSAINDQRAAPGAFIAQRADSVSALVNQIMVDKAVAARYTKHYGLSTDKLVQYFRENLSLTTLKKPVTVTTYYVTKKGAFLSKRKRLAAGTKVFVGPDGTPLLEWRCGNPLSKTLPFVSKPVVTTPTSVVQEIPEVRVAPAPTQELIVVPPPIAAATITEMAPVIPTISPVIEAAPAPPSILAPALAAAVPALFGAVHVKSKPPAVPEPASLVALGLGASTLLFQWKRKVRRN